MVGKGSYTASYTCSSENSSHVDLDFYHTATSKSSLTAQLNSQSYSDSILQRVLSVL